MTTGVLRVGIDGAAFRSPAAGVRRYVQELCRAVSGLGPDVEFVAIGVSARSDAPVGMPVVTARLSAPTNLGRHLVDLPLGWRRAAADVFHAPAYTAPLWGVRPIVLTIHDLSYEMHPDWYPYRRDPVRRAFYRLSALRADRIVTVSEFARKEIVAAYGIDPNRIAVIPHGVAAFLDAGRRGDTRVTEQDVQAPYVLHVGDLHERRNLAVALEAVVRIRRRHAHLGQLRLVLVGFDHGIGRALLGRALALGEPSALMLAGTVPDEQLARLYRRALAFVYPSRYEGFGLPLIEAMACGVPVVASRGAAVPEVVGSAGLLVDPDDGSGFAEALEAVLTKGDLATQLQAASLARASLFTWIRTATETVEVYRSCLSPSRRSSS